VSSVEIGENGFVVDAKIIAEALGIDAAQVQILMQTNAITSRCEKGEGDDEGRWRLTFYYNNRAFRLTVDSNSQILSRSQFDAPRKGVGVK